MVAELGCGTGPPAEDGSGFGAAAVGGWTTGAALEGGCGTGAVCGPLGVCTSGAWALAAVTPWARIAADVINISTCFRIPTSTRMTTKGTDSIL